MTEVDGTDETGNETVFAEISDYDDDEEEESAYFEQITSLSTEDGMGETMKKYH